MGIDLIDLAFRLEKRFGIQIERDQCAYFLTPGQIAWLVSEKLHGRNPAVPDYFAMWDRVQAALKTMPNYRRRWFHDYYSDLNRIVPSENRPQNWTALGEALGVPLPPLDHSSVLDPPAIPKCVSSLLSLSSWIMEHYPDRFIWKKSATECAPPVDADKWTNESIWEAIKKTISDALGVDDMPDHFFDAPLARFVAEAALLVGQA